MRKDLRILLAATLVLVVAAGIVRAGPTANSGPACPPNSCAYLPALAQSGRGSSSTPTQTPGGAPEPSTTPTPTITQTPRAGTPSATPTEAGSVTPTATATTTPTKTPTATPTSTATATPTQLPPSYNNCQADPNAAKAPNYPIRIVGIDKVGEVVTLQNIGPSAIDLSRWEMCSITGNQHHPIGGTLPAGAIGEYANLNTPIWNNTSRDDGALYDAQGRLVSYWADQ